MPELKLTVWGDSNTGLVRKNNEDYLTYFEPGDPQIIEQLGRLYIVADGVGGAATGEVASKYSALKVLHTYFSQPTLKPWQRIKAGMKYANLTLVNYIRQNAQARMATTMVAAAINGDELTIVNVGDSRAYLIRNQQVRQISQDHNLVNEMIRNGVLTEEQAKTAKVKNQLTSSLGGHEIFKADVFIEKLLPGDMVFMASDGLCRYAEELPIIQKIVLSGTPEQVVNNAIAYARKSGGQDNITVLMIRVNSAVDTLPMTEDNGTRPMAVDIETIVRDPLTMVARSPEQENKIVDATVVLKGLFKPDSAVTPITPADAMSIPGINQAATDEELEDTGDLGKHPANEEEKTRTITVDSMRIDDALKQRSPAAPVKTTPPPPEKIGFVQRTSIKGYSVLIMIAFMIFVLLGILAFTFGNKFFQLRNDGQTPTALVENALNLNSDEKPTDEMLVQNEETPIVEENTPEPPLPTEETVQENLGAGVCLAQVQSGDSLGGIIRDNFGLSYDANGDYTYRLCTEENSSIICEAAQTIADNNFIQTNWFIEVTGADYTLCQESNGTWLPLP